MVRAEDVAAPEHPMIPREMLDGRVAQISKCPTPDPSTPRPGGAWKKPSSTNIPHDKPHPPLRGSPSHPDGTTEGHGTLNVSLEAAPVHNLASNGYGDTNATGPT